MVPCQYELRVTATLFVDGWWHIISNDQRGRLNMKNWWSCFTRKRSTTCMHWFGMNEWMFCLSVAPRSDAVGKTVYRRFSIACLLAHHVFSMWLFHSHMICWGIGLEYPFYRQFFFYINIKFKDQNNYKLL